MPDLLKQKSEIQPGSFPEQAYQQPIQDFIWPGAPHMPPTHENSKNICREFNEDESELEKSQQKNTSYKKLIPYGLLIFLLIALFQVNGREKVEAASTPSSSNSGSIDILVPLVSIAAGERVDPSLMRSIPIRRSSLSKAQLLQVLMPDDLRNFHSPLIAKKTLPQQRAIFWKDLQLQRAPRKTIEASPILYSTEGKRP